MEGANIERAENSADKNWATEKKDVGSLTSDRSDKARDDRSLHEQTGAKPKESLERDVRDNGTGRGGYTRGEVTLPKEVWDKVWNSLPEDQRRAAQTNPTSTIYLMTSASRLGTTAENQNLSDARAKDAQAYLQDHFHVFGKVVTDSVGEQADPSHSEDDPRDRFMQINVDKGAGGSGNTDNDVPPKEIADSLANTAGLGDTSKQDNLPEFLNNAFETGKVALDILSNIMTDDIYGALKDAGKAAKELPAALADGISDGHYQMNIALNEIPAVHQQLDIIVFGKAVDNWPAPMENSPISGYNEKQRAEAAKFVASGRMIVDNWWKKQSPEMKKAMKDIAKDEARWHTLHQEIDKAMHMGLAQRRGRRE
jgi:hypothetical protein